MMICPGCKKETKTSEFCQWCFARLGDAPPPNPVTARIEQPSAPAPGSKGIYNPVVPISVKPAAAAEFAGDFDLSPKSAPTPPPAAMQMTQPVPSQSMAHSSASPGAPGAYNPLAPPVNSPYPSAVQTQTFKAGALPTQAVVNNMPPPQVPMPPYPQPQAAGAPGAQPLFAQPLFAQPLASPPMQPQETTKQVRMSLTGDVYEVEPSTAPAANYLPQGGPPNANYLQPGAVAVPPPMGHSATGRFSPANAGLPATAVTVGFVNQTLTDTVPISQRWELFLAIGMPILALSMLIIHLVPDIMIWVVLADMFLLGLAQAATRSIPSFDDALIDVVVVVFTCKILGPIPGIVVFFLFGAIKQEWNVGIISVLGVHIFTRLVMAVSFEAAADYFNLIPHISFMPDVGFLGVCASFAGAFCSSFFRPLDE